MTTASKEIRTWKAIGEYLGVDERTARRYADERGMPVATLFRIAVAWSDELDAWKKTQVRARRRRAA